jgi:hypothetical protein
MIITFCRQYTQCIICDFCYNSVELSDCNLCTGIKIAFCEILIFIALRMTMFRVLTLKMATVCISEIFVSTYESTRHQNPEHRCQIEFYGCHLCSSEPRTVEEENTPLIQAHCYKLCGQSILLLLERTVLLMELLLNTPYSFKEKYNNLYWSWIASFSQSGWLYLTSIPLNS